MFNPILPLVCMGRLDITVVSLCVCVYVCYHSTGGIIHFYSQTKLQTALLGSLLIFNAWIS